MYVHLTEKPSAFPGESLLILDGKRYIGVMPTDTAQYICRVVNGMPRLCDAILAMASRAQSTDKDTAAVLEALRDMVGDANVAL